MEILTCAKPYSQGKPVNVCPGSGAVSLWPPSLLPGGIYIACWAMAGMVVWLVPDQGLSPAVSKA